MYIKTYISDDTALELRAIVKRSHVNLKKRSKRHDLNKSRSKSNFNTKSYNDALQRSFNRAKSQIFFNPDMQYFVTLTYAGIENDYTKVMHDIKMLVKAENRQGNELKYIYVLEWQERGSLHVHMITNHALTTYINDNGYRSLTYWKHGYTSMLTIKDFDSNFKPYLYLFKYMRKAERIGKTFVHSSRNLNNFNIVDSEINQLDWNTINQESTYTQIMANTGRYKTLRFYTTYLTSYDTINLPLTKLKE